jgi:hypothetical protein
MGMRKKDIGGPSTSVIPSFINNVTYVREAGKRERWLE